jgi:hypothetical protein
MQKRIIHGLALAFVVLSLSMLAFNIHRAEAVALVGDVNGDGKVNLKDAFAISKAFGATQSSERWNPNADLNGDNIINLLDLYIVRAHFGQTA